MQKHYLASMCTVAVAGAIAVLVALPPVALGQAPREIRRVPGLVYDVDFEGQEPAPAPRRAISGVWEPAASAGPESTPVALSKCLQLEGRSMSYRIPPKVGQLSWPTNPPSG